MYGFLKLLPKVIYPKFILGKEFIEGPLYHNSTTSFAIYRRDHGIF